MQIGNQQDIYKFLYQPSPITDPGKTQELNSPSIAGVKAVRDGESGNSAQKVAGAECQTCKSRTYVDGSNDGNVSFKTPGHISPEASASVVSSHESEHVSNAVQEGRKEGNELISASVRLQMAICPECGRGYVAGGVTNTTIRYGETKYDNIKKSTDALVLRGANVDIKV